MVSISSSDFFKKTKFNEETQNQVWMSQIADSHDNICSCWHPFAHLLASIFPPGHKDRDLTINQILLRDYKEKCHSGGEEGENSGPTTGLITPKEEDTEKDGPEGAAEEDHTDALFAAAVENFER